ncbi:MAG TPA: gamma carbonic anhydrase family protein [Clostridia bacterium]|nr:gamma carbonic anhydrase family protein [Clostridia bacterium]
MIHDFDGIKPRIGDSVYIAPGAKVVGRVELGDKVNVWFNVVIRGDADYVTIGANTNIQDGSVLHQDAGFPLIIGRDVTIGHKALVHGCTIGDGVLIGMGSIILNGARIGKESVIGAGSLVLQGQEIPEGALAVGSPAKVVRRLSKEERKNYRSIADRYVKRSRIYENGG